MSPELEFLQSAFRKYYFDNIESVEPPTRIAEREFGYVPFGSGMVRHLSVKTPGELSAMMLEQSPADAYCSNAAYSFPEAQMGQKDWRGAELIFDVDAKDLDLECRPGHACSRCASCGAARRGRGPCECGGATESASFPCRRCIGAAKKEVSKLLEIMREDLGIGGAAVYFSGNEGFHVHVDEPAYARLDSRARAELCDYLSFRGATPESVGFARSGTKDPARHGEPGWRGRAAALLFPRSRRNKALKEAELAGRDAMQKRLEELSPLIGAVIDHRVTMDVHRIFRLPGTLNSKSGMAKVRCADPGAFDPYSEACLIDDEPARVVSDCPLQFRLRGRSFGPYSGEATVPRYAAAYMICKGFARVPETVRH